MDEAAHRKQNHHKAEHLLQSLLLSSEGGGDDRAALSRAVEVLESDDGSFDTGSLGGLGVIRGEGDLHRWTMQYEDQEENL